MVSANERRLYLLASSLIGWAHIHNDPWYSHRKLNTLKRLISRCKIFHMGWPKKQYCVLSYSIRIPDQLRKIIVF